MVKRDTDLYDLTVKAGTRTAVIHTTAGHLFWVPSLNKWLRASNLKPGEHLKTPDGSVAVAEGGTTPKVHDGWMWDLTVPGNNDHDFYVAVAATNVLVHNCPEDVPQIEEHVIPRHTPGGAEADDSKSLFDPGTNLERLAEGSSGQIGVWQRATSNIRYFIRSSSIIGTDLNGLPTNIYTIIRDGYSGDLVTMHPGLPSDLAG
jgi:hypothetical protein